jgi:hypothetical protein
MKKKNLRVVYKLNQTASPRSLLVHRYFAASGVQLAQTNPSGQFHFRRAAFSAQLTRNVGLALAKATVLRINLNLDGVVITS